MELDAEEFGAEVEQIKEKVCVKNLKSICNNILCSKSCQIQLYVHSKISNFLSV